MALKFDDDQDGIMADINVTPLIDIMLVLLILFMVTSSVSLDSGMDINLPEVGSGVESKEKGAVIISLDKEGNVSVQGKLVSVDNIVQVIQDSLKSESTDLVILEGDRESNLGSAVKLMDYAKTAGATQFAIAADGKN